MDPYIKKYTDYLRYISGIEDDILNSNNELIDREDLDTDQDVRVFGMMRPAFSLAEVEYINEDHITATSLHLHSNKKEGIVEFKKLLTKYSHDSEEAEKFGF